MAVILRALFLLLVVFSASTAFASISCQKLLARKEAFAAADLHQKLKMVTAPKPPLQLSDEKIKEFWQTGFTFLKGLAASHSTTLKDLLGGYFAMYELVMNEVDSTRGAQLSEAHTRFLQSLEKLENSPVSVKKFGPYRDDILILLEGLQHLASGLGVFDALAGRKELRVDPQTVHDPKVIRFMFEAFEMHTLDSVVANYDRAQDEIRRAQYEDWMSGKFGDVDDFFTKDESDFEENFAAAVREKLPIKAGHSYKVTNARNEEMTVVIAKEVTDLMLVHGSERDVIYRLLGYIMTGRGDTSGVKTLFTIGPRIVEVKGVFHGHKRLIGCLEGRTLYIRQFMELPVTGVQYRHYLSSDYCQ